MEKALAAGMYNSLRIGWIDSAIILVYLIGIVGVGCWAGFRRKEHEGDAYFLGGRTLTWPVIGAALFASNISTVHMVSLAECGYKSGLLYGNFEWMAPFTLICLSLFFAPFYIRSNVTTLPDFLEKRYSRASRDWLTLLSIMAAIVIHIGFAFYAGARVLHGMFGIDTNVCIFVVAGLAGLYTIVGGLLAVMWTESIQTIILLAGAICITVLGLQHVGGWQGLQQSVHPVNFSLIRPSSDPTGLSKWAVFLGYPVIGLWYWCCDQVIVQRVLAAKDENHARVGPLFTGFIKILPMFIFVLPGLICLGLVSQNPHVEPLEDPKDTLTYLINHVLPTGVKGIMAAALLAAMMGSVSAALNSIATVFSYDVVKRWRPETSERRLVLIGRIVTGVAMGLAILWSPWVGGFGTIFQGANDLICYMAPPVTAVFLLGVFWRKASSRAALITMLSGSCIGAAVFVVDFFKIGQWSLPCFTFDNGSPALAWTERGPWNVHSMITGFVMFVIAVITLVVFSCVFPDARTRERDALVWKDPLEPLRGKTWRFWGNYRVLAAVLFVTMIGLYWHFRGTESYYPVAAKVLWSDGTPVVGAQLTFESDKPKYAFTQVTDREGRFVYGSDRMAGGAPAGTYRVRIVQANDETARLDNQGSVPRSIPTKYGSCDSSGLQFVCEPKQNRFSLILAAQAVGVSAATGVSGGGAVGVRNGSCAIEFAPDTGALTSILNVALVDQILKDKPAGATPFRIHADFSNEWVIDANSEKAAQVHLGPEGLRLTGSANKRTPQGEDLDLTYSGGGFECVLRVGLEAGSGDSTWTLAVKNVGVAPRAAQVEFPRFAGVQLGAKGSKNQETVLDQAGYIADAWTIAGGIYGTGDGNGGRWSMQWHSMFDPASRSALGLIVMDPGIRNKKLVMDRPCLSVQYFPPQTLAPGETLVMPPLRVLVHQGDWKRTARAYADWYAKAFHQAKPPQWFLEGDSWEGRWLAKKSPQPPVFLGAWPGSGGTELMMRLDSFRDLPAAAIAKPYDNIEYAYWERSAMLHNQCIAGDYQVREDLGGPEAMREAFAGVRKLGLHSTLYLNAYIIHETSDLAKTGKAQRWSMMHHDRSITGRYSDYKFYHPCPGCVEWQDYLAATIGRLLKETGADGIRLDSVGYYNHPCYNPAHHHRSPFDYNEWIGQLLSKVRTAALAANPDALLTTEGVIDFYGQWFHGGLTQAYPRDVPPMRLAVGPHYRALAYSPVGPVWGSISGLAGGGRMPGADVNWQCASSPVHDTLTSGDLADDGVGATDPEIITRRFTSQRCEAIVVVRPACKENLWPLLQGISSRRARYEVLISAGPTPPKRIATCDIETLRWQGCEPSIRDGTLVVGTESNWLLVIIPRGGERVVVFDPLPEARPGSEVTLRPVALAGDGSPADVEVWAPGLQIGVGSASRSHVCLGETATLRVPKDAPPGWYQVRLRGNNVLGAKRLLHIIRRDS